MGRQCLFPHLNRNSIAWLNWDITPYEIKLAIFRLRAHKAPGPDGFPAFFFQRSWDVVGDSVVKFVMEIFDSGTVLVSMNRSLISLLPKHLPPESMAQFCPIYLSNVIMKVITKVIAHRLKPLMSQLTGDAQTSFIPERHATDNVIIVQELIHSLSRRKGRTGSMVAKIDLEKAYDRIEWPFLEEVLKIVGFNSKLLTIVMGCITSTQLSVIWNGEQLDPFMPGRGLRQGDPLSPYLFALCMEVLHHKIQAAVEENRWTPCAASQGGPQISHLFFVDDLLLFGEASIRQAECMQTILDSFCKESGQRVNLTKSHLWCSPNTRRSLKRHIHVEFGVPTTSDLGMYLRLKTKELLWRRRVLDSPICDLCGMGVESTLHAVRDCIFPKVIWTRLLSAARNLTFWGSDHPVFGSEIICAK